LSGDAITPPTIEPLVTAPGMSWDTLTTNGGGTLLIVGGDRLISVGNNTVLQFSPEFLGTGNTLLVIGCNLVITKLQ
jgi:hypothetical protein